MKKILLCLSFALAIVMSGCSSKKNFIYMSDMIPGVDYPVNYQQTVIQRDDRLRITVSCKKPELALPFNLGLGSLAVGSDGSVRGAGNVDNSYRVNTEGMIDFPILGQLRVGGLTIQQAQDYIRDLIIDGDYIKDPIVTIDFLNFHYTVLGAVGSNGTKTVNGDRVTLIEAIANAGDLTSKADLGGIMVIREENGERKAYEVDIRETDILNSPVYYLQQNDIVYVKPKYAKKDHEDRTTQWITLLFSAISAACTVIWALRR